MLFRVTNAFRRSVDDVFGRSRSRRAPNTISISAPGRHRPPAASVSGSAHFAAQGFVVVSRGLPC